MKTFKFLVLLTLILSSCQDELELDNIENNHPKKVPEKTVKNGRFIFSSKESLKTTIEDFQNDEIENVEKEFEKLYEQGFRSHKPIINPENEELQAKFSEEIREKRQLNNTLNNYYSKNSSTENEEGEFIADPLLASLVNEANEIVVNDTLYKFSKGKGLFFTHVKDSTYLFEFFKEDSEQANRPSSKSASTYKVVSSCEMRTQYGGVTRVDGIISRYLRPINRECDGGDGSSSGASSSSGGSSLSEDEKLQKIINGLPECDGNAGGNWFQNMFGKSYVCRNYFDSKHRIKTEFWDQSWLFYESVGVLTKTQRKRFSIWWASDSDEIHLGVNHILLKYNYKQPVITAINFTAPYKFPLYMYKGIIQAKHDNNYINTEIDVPVAKIPFFNFENGDILNIYIPNTPFLGTTNINLTTQDITSQSNIEGLYKLGIDFLKSKFKTGVIPKEFAVTYQKNTNEIEVLYFGERFKATNKNKLKRKFYSDVSFVISASWGDATEKWKYQIKPAKSAFRNYTHYEVDFYGMARRGSTWRGNRMIR